MKRTAFERAIMINDILQKYEIISEELSNDASSADKCRAYLVEVNNILIGLRVYLKNENDPAIAFQLGQTIRVSEKLIAALKRRILILEVGETMAEISELFEE